MLKYTPTIRITNCQTKKYLPVEQQWSWKTVGHSLQTLRQQMGKCRRELPRLYSKDQCLQSRIHESRQEPWGNSENTNFKHYEPGTKQPWWWSYDLGSGSGHDKTLVHKKPVSLVWASDVSSLKKNGLSMKMSFCFCNLTFTLVKWPQDDLRSGLWQIFGAKDNPLLFLLFKQLSVTW